MIRWLYLCSDLGIPLDGTKGASEHVRAITRALAREGQDVAVLAARGELPEEHPARQIRHGLGSEARRLGERARRWLASVDGPVSMATELSQLAYDAALAEALESDAFGLNVDVVVERLSLFSAAGREFARRRRIPYLVEMNAPLAQEAARYRDASLQALGLSVERQTLEAADCVMTVSNELRDHVIGELGIAPARVVTVPNGVELELFQRPYDRSAARREAGVPQTALVFGFVGSLKVWHGVEVLVEAFARVRSRMEQAHLLIIGDGRRMEHERARARELGLQSSVTFFGGTDHASVARLLSAMDVAVAPYLPQPNFYFSPLKLYEYMAAGLCVIASRAGQIREAIDDGHSGLLVSPGDASDLARAMLHVGQDAALRARLGAMAQQSVARRGWDATARQIIELAQQATRRRGESAREVAHAGI